MSTASSHGAVRMRRGSGKRGSDEPIVVEIAASEEMSPHDVTIIANFIARIAYQNLLKAQEYYNKSFEQSANEGTDNE
jgi:hypothetical protein